MLERTQAVIGYVVDVQGNALTATLVEDEQGQAPTVTVGDEDIVVGRIGSYVAIRQNAVNVIAMVTRMTEKTCATELVMPAHDIRQKLPLNEAVEITFTPSDAGELRYACGMDMISGTIVVD